MQTDIHPNYHNITVKCGCGNAFETRSTYSKDELHVEICSKCHPFYTGKQKLIDTAGRVDRFKKRYANLSTGAKKPADDEK
jgi:large subunit ribosomal protein L31